MSQSAGPGSPLTFRCYRCRRGDIKYSSGLSLTSNGRGWFPNVDLTGRKRKHTPNKHSMRGVRSDSHKREYTCRDCGYVGWSAHVQLRELEAARTP